MTSNVAKYGQQKYNIGCLSGIIFGLWVGGALGLIIHGYTTHTLFADDPDMCLPENICGECGPESEPNMGEPE